MSLCILLFFCTSASPVVYWVLNEKLYKASRVGLEDSSSGVGIVAIEGLIPDRKHQLPRRLRPEQIRPSTVHPQIDTAAWLREQLGKPPALSLAPTLPGTKMCLAFPIPRPVRQARLRTLALLRGPDFRVPSGSIFARPRTRKRPLGASRPRVRFCSRQTGSLPQWEKETRCPAPEALKKRVLPML